VYSVDNAESFKSIPFWIKEIKNQSHPDIKLILVGNKTDLSDKREVSTEEGEQFAKENEMDLFLETSAKSGDGVSYMVYSCVARLALVEQVNEGGIEKVVEELEEGNKNREQSSIYDIVKERDNELNVKGSSTCNDGNGGKEKKDININETNNTSSNSKHKKKKKKCC
jgi:GTPase SAR1 family protein